jgi:hypothetical protein
MMWLVGPSLGHPTNFGICEGVLVGMGSQARLCNIGSLVSFAKLKRFRLVIYGKLGVRGGGTPCLDNVYDW